MKSSYLASGSLGQLLKNLQSAHNKNVEFNTYNNVRYTFLVNVFEHYNLNDKQFNLYLQKLQSSYIWNVYKSLTQDFIQKAQSMPYNKVMEQANKKILQPMKATLLEKVPQGQKPKDNAIEKDMFPFCLVFNQELDTFLNKF